jgi:hypothetical protein
MKRASLLTLLLLVACSGDAPVHSDYNPTIDFSTYQSFSFDVSDVQASEESVARDPRVMETIRQTIVDDLGSRPMLWRESGGDLSISILVAASEETVVDQWGVNWDQDGGFTPGGQAFQYKAGTLVIDFFDTATGQLAWRGWAHSAVTRTDDADLDYLARVVLAMLEQYPPASGED